MTNVLAFNSSPKMNEGGTDLLLRHFLAGMNDAGAETELLYVEQLEVNPCTGCYGCWVETPGRCAVYRDDMDRVIDKMGQADIIVLGTPLYVGGMSGTLKMLMDRSIPLRQPFLEMHDGIVRHPRREGVKSGKLVLVSASGLPLPMVFNELVAHVKHIARNMDREFAGAILRPYAAILPSAHLMGVPKEKIEAIYNMIRDAGKLLVQDGAMPAETLDAISQALMPHEQFVDFVNTHFTQELAKLEDA